MYFSRPNIPGYTFANFHNINFFELQSGKSMSLPSMSRRLHCEWKKWNLVALHRCTALQKLLELVQNTAYCNCNMSHYSQLHYTVIWWNALFWTQLNHAVHYVTAPLHCIALVCITLCKHEHCDTWMYYSLNYTLCNFTVHFTITALNALCYCTVHCDIALW